MGTPFWPIYLRDLGHLSPPELAAITTLVYAGPLLTALVTTPFWGRLGDRLGHRPMVLRALLALAACLALVMCLTLAACGGPAPDDPGAAPPA